MVSYSAVTGGFAIPLATLFALCIVPIVDRENEGCGRWFDNTNGIRITVVSAIVASLGCAALLALVVGFGWPGAWSGGIGKAMVHFINPGTLLLLMSLVWSLGVFKRYQSTRLGVMAFFPVCV